MKAIYQSPHVINHLDEQPEHLCRLAISLDYQAIAAVRDQT